MCRRWGWWVVWHWCSALVCRPHLFDGMRRVGAVRVEHHRVTQRNPPFLVHWGEPWLDVELRRHFERRQRGKPAQWLAALASTLTANHATHSKQALCFQHAFLSAGLTQPHHKWLAGWLAGCLVGCLVGWLVGWLVDWLVGWLIGGRCRSTTYPKLGWGY